MQHYWGDDFDWKGLNHAIDMIAIPLKRWGRVNVVQYKEKFGEARIYCSMGWNQLHCITHPGHCYSRYPKWLWTLDCKYGSKVVPVLFNWFIIPYHKWLYRYLYKMAVKKFPHIYDEIVDACDYPELLKGI